MCVFRYSTSDFPKWIVKCFFFYMLNASLLSFKFILNSVFKNNLVSRTSSWLYMYPRATRANGVHFTNSCVINSVSQCVGGVSVFTQNIHELYDWSLWLLCSVYSDNYLNVDALCMADIMNTEEADSATVTNSTNVPCLEQKKDIEKIKRTHNLAMNIIHIKLGPTSTLMAP